VAPIMAFQKRLWNHYKSMGERKIGTYLHRRRINFTYERPVAVVYQGKTKLFYPDFFLDDYHILIEYLGMNGNPQKAKLNNYKRRAYTENGYDVIEIYPRDFGGDWERIIERGIHDTLEQRMRDYKSRLDY
jgi:hypothetical protein